MATLKVTNIKNESFAGDQLYLKSDGRLGIGTTSPDTLLHLSAANPVLRFQDSDGTNQLTEISNAGGHTYIKSRNNTGGGNLYINTWDNANSNYPTLFTILNGGNVGIGTTSPSSIFHVRPLDETNFLVRNEGSTVVLASETNSGRDNNRGMALEATAFEFIEGGSEKMRIDTNGNVGIGTTSPSCKLNVVGVSGTNPTTQINHSNADVTGEFLRLARTDLPAIRYHSLMAQHGGAAAANLLTFKIHNGSTTTSQSEVLSVIGNGNVKITDGDLVIGTSGHGIDFSVTSDAGGATSELLDDYEEGSFTATLTATDLTLTSNTYTCYYTKVGRLVHVSGYAAGTTPADISAYVANTVHNMTIGGLPFTNYNSIGARGAASIGVNSGFTISSNHYLSNHGNANQNTISIWQEPETEGVRIGPVLIANKTMTMHFCFTYNAA